MGVQMFLRQVHKARKAGSLRARVRAGGGPKGGENEGHSGGWRQGAKPPGQFPMAGNYFPFQGDPLKLTSA